MNKKLINILILGVFFILSAYFVSAQALVSVTAPTTGSTIGGDVTITFTVTGATNITNYTVSIIDSSNTVTTILSNNSESINASSYTIVWDSSAIAEGSGYTLNVTVWNMTYGDGPDFNTTLVTGLTIDGSKPNSTLTFQNPSGTSAVEFPAGTEITINCNAAEGVTGLNSSRNAIQISYPGITSYYNITTKTNTNSSLTAVLQNDKTLATGTYGIKCFVFDKGGNLNESTSSFVIVQKLEAGSTIGSSPFSNPSFVKPVGKVKVNTGTTNDGGRLTTEGTSRLIKVNGMVKFDIKGEDHLVTLKSFTEDAAVFSVESEEIEVTVAAEETKAVDVNQDGISDMEITFHKVFPKGGEFVDVTFTLTESPAEETGEETTGEETTVDVGEDKEDYKAPKSGLAVTIAVIVIVLIIGYALIRGKRK